MDLEVKLFEVEKEYNLGGLFRDRRSLVEWIFRFLERYTFSGYRSLVIRVVFYFIYSIMVLFSEDVIIKVIFCFCMVLILLYRFIF